MQRAWAVRLLIGLGLIVALILVAPARTANAGSGLAEAIIQPERDKIELCREGIAFLDEQAQVRQQEMQAWLSYHQKQFAAVDVKCQTLMKTWAETMAKADAAKAALEGLILDNGKGHLPHYGWQSLESMKKHVDALQKQYDDVKEQVTNGDLRVHVQIIGWTTRKALQASVEKQQGAIDDFNKAVAAGTFRAPVPGFQDWASRVSLEARIQRSEEAIEKLTGLITSGEFSVHIPTIGWTTRNALEARIASVEKSLEDLEASFSEKKARIHRPLFGWWALADLESSIETKQKAYAEYEKHIKTSVWKAHFPAAGWLSGEEIETKIKGLEKTVTGINDALSSGTYPVGVSGYGMLNKTEIQSRLAALAKQKDVQDKVSALKKGLNDIGTASSVDLAIYALDKSMYTSWIAELLKFAQPWLEAKKLELTELGAHRNDWDQDLQLNIAIKKRELAHLAHCLDFVP